MPTSSADRPRLLALHPAGPAWPANILRFHLAFDREMDPAGAAGQVGLETADGRPVRGALADLPDGLWSPDGRVLTLLFHPGRVKRGLGAHERLGRALVPGRACRLVVGPDLADTGGRRFGLRLRIAIRAVREETRPLEPARWRWAPPVPGSRDPVTIHAGRMLDALSVQGALAFADAGGAALPVRFEVAGDRVLARPGAAWPEGVSLRAGPALEDVCGNRPGRAFERGAAGGGAPAPRLA